MSNTTSDRLPIDTEAVNHPNRHLDEQSVRVRLLAAAAAEFTSPDYPVFNNVSLSRIARRAGLSERTAFRYFTTSEVREALPAYLFDTVNIDQGWTDNAADTVEDIAVDNTTTVAQLLETVAAQALDAAAIDPTIGGRFAVWPYAEGNPAISSALHNFYEDADRRTRRVLNSFVAANASQLRFRDELISIEQLAAVMNTLFEGFAMRSLIDEALGNKPSLFDAELAGTVVKILIATLMGANDDDSDPVDEQLRLFDELTGRPTSTLTTEPDQHRPLAHT